MNSSPDNTYRRFLLGIASEEEECSAEEAILTGALDALFLQTAEDELIDDYLFGSLTGEERLGFEEHFLISGDRRQKLRFGSSLVEYARAHPTESDSLKHQSIQGNGRLAPFWKRTAFLAAAASILFATIVAFDQMRLRRQTQIANETDNELTRLRASLASENSGASQTNRPYTGSFGGPIDGIEIDQVSVIELPYSTRDVHLTQLSITPHTKMIRIDVELPLPLAVRYREVLLTSNGEELWAQEFPASILPQAEKSTIVLPASILPPGEYHFNLEKASAKGQFEQAGDWTLQVPRE